MSGPVIRRRQNTDGVTKMKSKCGELAAMSYQCLEKAMGDGSKCGGEFDAYKACKKDEHTRMLERRRESLER